MFFLYKGKDPLNVRVLRKNRAVDTITIFPSEFGQRTNDEDLYALIMSKDFEHAKLFQKLEGFRVPKPQVKMPEPKPEPKKKEGGK